MLEPAQTVFLVLLHPAAAGLLVHEQNLPHRPITRALRDPKEGRRALALMPLHLHVFVAPGGFLVIAFTQPLCLLTPSPVISQFAARLL